MALGISSATSFPQVRHRERTPHTQGPTHAALQAIARIALLFQLSSKIDMHRRERPPVTQRSEHWMRKAVNEHRDALNSLVASVFRWDPRERIEWQRVPEMISNKVI
jgi:hypothetical protein